MNLNDYTDVEQDELKAISASMASVEKLEVLSARIDAEHRQELADNIASVKASLKWREQNMADMVALRKIRFFA